MNDIEFFIFAVLPPEVCEKDSNCPKVSFFFQLIIKFKLVK